MRYFEVDYYNGTILWGKEDFRKKGRIAAVIEEYNIVGRNVEVDLKGK